MVGLVPASDRGMVITCRVSSHRMTASLFPGKAAFVGDVNTEAVSGLPTCSQLRAWGSSVLLLHTMHSFFGAVLVRSRKKIEPRGQRHENPQACA